MRDAKGFEFMDGMEYVASIPKGEIITAMCEVDGNLFVSTDKHIYILADKKRLERVDE